MPDITVDQIVQDVKSGLTNQDRTAVFNRVHQDITELQNQDGGSGSARFRDDLSQLNERLHKENILPAMQITGVEDGKPSIPGNKFSFGTHDTIQISDGMPKHDPKQTDILSVHDWYPGLVGPLSPTEQNLVKVSKDALGQQLWSVKHPSPGLADSPDPPGAPRYGGPGGYGCAPSAAEALRRAGILNPNEDPLCVQDVQMLLQNSHGWKPVFDSRNDPVNAPNIQTQVLKPGDVICGYRHGDSHSGAGAHVGIVGEDGKVYSHALAPDPNNPGYKHEEWTQSDLSMWMKEDYTDGMVVLRAPDAV